MKAARESHSRLQRGNNRRGADHNCKTHTIDGLTSRELRCARAHAVTGAVTVATAGNACGHVEARTCLAVCAPARCIHAHVWHTIGVDTTSVVTQGQGEVTYQYPCAQSVQLGPWKGKVHTQEPLPEWVPVPTHAPLPPHASVT